MSMLRAFLGGQSFLVLAAPAAGVAGAEQTATIAQTPPQQTPSQQTPSQQTPSQQTPSQQTPSQQTSVASPYAAFAFLIGAWDTTRGDGQRIAVQRFRWGPNRSYIWYSTSTLASGQEQVHFEGLLIWNFAHRNADFLFALAPGSGAQEQGTIHVEAYGVLVRDVRATDAAGHIQSFRQSFRRTGPDTALTSLERRNPDGTWAPNFPGSVNLVMTRRA
jgi:hypothetical protein